MTNKMINDGVIYFPNQILAENHAEYYRNQYLEYEPLVSVFYEQSKERWGVRRQRKQQ